MKALYLTNNDPFTMEVREIPIPIPGPDEVLVLNKGSLLFQTISFAYNKFMKLQQQLPQPLGAYAAGDVVQTGSDEAAQSLQGKRVYVRNYGGGAYMEYIVAKTYSCIVLPDNVSYEQATCIDAMGLSAMCIIDYLEEHKVKAFCKNAGGSVISGILRKWANINNIDMIDIVRRESTAQQLRDEGAKYIVNSSDIDFSSQLSELAQRLGVTVAIDSIGGDQTRRIQEVMPIGCTICIFGLLGKQVDCQFDGRELMFKNQKIEPIILPFWPKLQDPIFMQQAITNVMNDQIYQIPIDRVITSFDELIDALNELEGAHTRGKVIFNPNPQLQLLFRKHFRYQYGEKQPIMAGQRFQCTIQSKSNNLRICCNPGTANQSDFKYQQRWTNLQRLVIGSNCGYLRIFYVFLVLD